MFPKEAVKKKPSEPVCKPSRPNWEKAGINLNPEHYETWPGKPAEQPPEVPAQCTARVWDNGDMIDCGNGLPCAEHKPEVPAPDECWLWRDLYGVWHCDLSPGIDEAVRYVRAREGGR
jgi:hypothetical protein